MSQLFFSIANRPKLSPNIIFCSIKMTPHATSIRTLDSSVLKQCSLTCPIVYTLEGTIKDLCGFKATVICRYKVYMESIKSGLSP